MQFLKFDMQFFKNHNTATFFQIEKDPRNQHGFILESASIISWHRFALHDASPSLSPRYLARFSPEHLKLC